ncbi:MAG: CBS domain-containing protein [Anaerolineales bacterium]
MTKEDELITARVGSSAKEARDILQKHRIEKPPLVDEDGILKGLLTVKDIQEARDYPNTATDSKGNGSYFPKNILMVTIYHFLVTGWLQRSLRVDSNP